MNNFPPIWYDSKGREGNGSGTIQKHRTRSILTDTRAIQSSVCVLDNILALKFAKCFSWEIPLCGPANLLTFKANPQPVLKSRFSTNVTAKFFSLKRRRIRKSLRTAPKKSDEM